MVFAFVTSRSTTTSNSDSDCNVLKKHRRDVSSFGLISHGPDEAVDKTADKMNNNNFADIFA